MTKKEFHKVIIGRSALLHFQDLNIADIPSKVDTGAYRSSVHATDIRVSDEGNELTFTLLGNHPVFGSLAKEVTTNDFSIAYVTNSFGHQERRFAVDFRVKLGPKIFTESFTLANREKMVFPILIGRKLLNDRFLVDPAYTSVDRLELKQQYNIDLPEDEGSTDAYSNSIER